MKNTFEVGQIYKYANGKTITVAYVGSESVTFVNRSGCTRAFTFSYLRSNQCPLTFVGVDSLAVQTKDERVKELEDTVLGLQSELARKKMSLTVACNRVEELEAKLAKCQEIAMGLGIKYNEQQDKLKIAIGALKFYGNHESWINRDIAGDIWHRASPKQHGDSETIRHYEHPNTDWVGTVVVGGKKAREALEQRGIKK